MSMHLRLIAVACLLPACNQPDPPSPAAPGKPTTSEQPQVPSGPEALNEFPPEVRESQIKLRGIGVAFVNYLDRHSYFPAGFGDEKGRPILSWRVALLPDLGHAELFKQFRLNEPWDSPHNIKLLPKMPDVFKPVKGKVEPGRTYYQGFVGLEAIFPPALWTPKTITADGWFMEFRGRRRSHVRDGLYNTLLVVEGRQAVPWSKPEDLPYDPKKPLPKLGGQFDGEFNALFCDGSVRFVPRTTPEKTLRGLITPAGGEVAALPEPSRHEPESKGLKELPAEVRQSQDKLRRIGEAFLSRLDRQEDYAAGFSDADGKPILSWRVALLPDLGHAELFKQFKLNEPWDSAHNVELVSKMPDVFKSVKGKTKPGHTYYRGFTGPQAMFPAVSKPVQKILTNDSWQAPLPGRRIAAVVDGTSYTLLAVEGAEAVPWTKPDELAFDPEKPLPRVGGPFEGDFNALFCDGSVHLVPRTIPEKMLRALITPAGGEPIDLREIGLTDPLRGPPAKGPQPLAKPGDVSGKITFKGVPLRGGTVTFYPAAVKPLVAQIAEDGTFSLTNVPGGRVLIAVETRSAKGPGFLAIPAKYNSPRTSSLTCAVQPGKQVFDIDLNE